MLHGAGILTHIYPINDPNLGFQPGASVPYVGPGYNSLINASAKSSDVASALKAFADLEAKMQPDAISTWLERVSSGRSGEVLGNVWT